MPPCDVNFDSNRNPLSEEQVWTLLSVLVRSSGTLLHPDPHHPLWSWSWELDEITTFKLDLHSFRLLLNDACLLDGNLLSTGSSTELFRYELLIIEIHLFWMRDASNSQLLLHVLFREKWVEVMNLLSLLCHSTLRKFRSPFLCVARSISMWPQTHAACCLAAESDPSISITTF